MSSNQTHLLDEAFSALTHRQGQKALGLYETVILRIPNEPIGYVGKAVSLLLAEENVSYSNLFAPILKAATLRGSEEYAESLSDLINFQTPPYNSTLLHHACTYKHYDVVKALVDLGANIHIKGEGGMTALWYLTFKPIAQEKLADSVKIAKLFLSLGAQIDVTNGNGVALYNKNTDPDIVKVIHSYYPDAKPGSAGALSDSDPKPRKPFSMAAVFSLIAVVLGVLLTFLFQMPMLGGGIITLAMVIGGFLIGTLIDEAREEGSGAGRVLKLILIYIVVIGAGFFLFNACGNGLVTGSSSGSSSYYTVTCPKCGTGYRSNHPAGQAVQRNGVCGRCN